MGNLVCRVERLEMRCTQCPRRGRAMLDKLIAEHGAGMDLPQLGHRVAADCLWAQATSPAERCFVIFPQLLDLPTARPAAK